MSSFCIHTFVIRVVRYCFYFPDLTVPESHGPGVIHGLAHRWKTASFGEDRGNKSPKRLYPGVPKRVFFLSHPDFVLRIMRRD